MNITSVTIQQINHFVKIREIFAGLDLEIMTINGDLSNSEDTFGKYDICARSTVTGNFKMYRIDLYGKEFPEEGMYY